MPRSSTSDELARLARRAAGDLRAGRLQLCDVLGLEAAELEALRALAESCRRRGELEEAAAVLGVVISCNPTDARGWQAMGDLQRARGELALAIACYELGALLGARDAGAAAREAESLRQIGHPELAELLEEERC